MTPPASAYAAFLAIMVGFLLMWPTLPTLVMFSVLAWVYRRLVIREEAQVAGWFGRKWAAYAAATPRFLPRFGVRELPRGPSSRRHCRHAGARR